MVINRKIMKVKKGKKRARASLPKQNAQSSIQKKKFEKKTENDKKAAGGKTLLIAQEVKFARLLANNDQRVRDKVLKNLRKWLTLRSQTSFAFTETDFLRLWKGLFYCMWMSDKPLVQEDLAESLSKLVHCFNSKDTALLYTKCTLKSLATEWFGIDRYRVDKFEMLVRKIIRQTFEMCKKRSWNEEWVVGTGKVMQEILLDPKTCLGLNLHITEIYMEELAKISQGNIPTAMVTKFITPFILYLAGASDQRQMRHIVKNIFRYLIFQSDVGMDYIDKFQAWRQAGFPCQNINEIQKIEVSDEEDVEEEEEEEGEGESNENSQTEEKPLDPRAGRVDVEIPQIPFDPAGVAIALQNNKFHKSSSTKSRKHITQLINDFTKLIKGDMPFGIKEIPIPDKTRLNPYEYAENLLEFEDNLYADSNKRSRKRKKKNAPSNESEDVINFADSLSQNEDKIEEVSSKKQKLIENEVNELKEKDNRTNKKKLSKKMLKKLKKKSDRLNISESILNKKKKKSLNKLDKTVTESPLEPEVSNIECSSKDCSIDSTNFTWNIDVVKAPPKAKNSSKGVIKHKSTLKKKKSLPKEEISPKKSKQNIPWLTPVLTRLEQQSKTPSPKKSPKMLLKKTLNSPKAELKLTPTTDSAKKRVKIMLQKNTAQCTSEYFRSIRMSPAIPFDADRKPKAGVLKPSPLPSPINPFYKKKNFLKL